MPQIFYCDSNTNNLTFQIFGYIYKYWQINNITPYFPNQYIWNILLIVFCHFIQPRKSIVAEKPVIDRLHEEVLH